MHYVTPPVSGTWGENLTFGIKPPKGIYTPRGGFLGLGGGNAKFCAPPKQGGNVELCDLRAISAARESAILGTLAGHHSSYSSLRGGGY